MHITARQVVTRRHGTSEFKYYMLPRGRVRQKFSNPGWKCVSRPEKARSYQGQGLTRSVSWRGPSHGRPGHARWGRHRPWGQRHGLPGHAHWRAASCIGRSQLRLECCLLHGHNRLVRIESLQDINMGCHGMLRGSQCVIQAAASCFWKATGCTEIERHSVVRWPQASVTGIGLGCPGMPLSGQHCIGAALCCA